MEPLVLRQLLETIEGLNESTGLAGRKPGDTFKDDDGNTITFDSINFYPAEGGALEPGDLDVAVADFERSNGTISWENSRSSRTGGFAVATFTDGGDNLYVGTYLQKTKANPTDNYVSNTVLGKYKYGGKAAEKTRAGLTPQDLLAKSGDLTVPDIMNQLAAKLGTDNPLYHVAHHVATGGSLPYEIKEPPGGSFTAFRDYFCEILQPIALHTGVYSGNAGVAAEQFLDPEGFAGTRINFDNSKNAGLSDSRLELPDGRYVKVSSKGNKGAEASIKNLTDCINELGDTPEGRKLKNKYSEVIGIISDLQVAGQSGAPLFLGVKYGVIDPAEAQVIKGLKGSAPVDLRNKERLKSLGLTSNLISLADGRTTKKPESTSLYFHLIASIAHKVAEKINTDTDFSEAASTILNNGALVQVYTKASKRGAKWVLEGFDTHYPGSSVTGVQFSAQKNYSSTAIKGNFTFRILRGAKPEKESNVDTTATTASTGVDIKPPEERGINPLKSRSGSEDGAGRKRR